MVDQGRVNNSDKKRLTGRATGRAEYTVYPPRDEMAVELLLFRTFHAELMGDVYILWGLKSRFQFSKISISGSLPVKFEDKKFLKNFFIAPKDAALNFRENFGLWR